MTRRSTPVIECSRCQGIGSVCLNCEMPIDDCECMDDSMPCPCDECHGTGTKLFDDEDES